MSHAGSRANVVQAQFNQIASAKFAVDGEIEDRKVAL
jgi:hypothetical protein